MPGLCEVWKKPYSETLLAYTIITTETRPGIRARQEKMPVIPPREAEEVCLDPGVNETGRLLSLLRLYPDIRINAYRVGEVWVLGLRPIQAPAMTE
jgi:putative SOS response-associated peptidase YedK